MNNPLVSIIIPTYNRSHLIGETLDSVLAQTYQNWECIVVDDGSTDYTDELMEFYCEKDPRIQYHHRPKNRLKGANACRNYGFEESKGAYINWFDSDDLMHHEKIKLQVMPLNEKGKEVSVSQNLVFKESKNNIIGLRHPKIYSSTPFEEFLMLKVVWLTSSLLLKREVLLRTFEFFNEELLAAQEWEFFSRILYSKPLIYFIDTPLNLIRQHEESISHKRETELIRHWNYFIARLLIYKNKNIELTLGQTIYLRKFLFGYFKFFVRNGNTKQSLKCFFEFLIIENSLVCKYKIYCFISIISYKLFGRGDALLKKASLNYIRE